MQSSDAATKASSFSATFHATIVSGGKAIDEDGTIAFRAPADEDMTFTIDGAQSELLVLPPDIYTNIDGGGWYSVGSELIDADAYRQFAKNRGPVDYADTIDGLQDVHTLPDDSIDGLTYLHYSGTYDFSNKLGKLLSGLLKPGVADLITTVVPDRHEYGMVELWINPDTRFPRRVSIDANIESATSSRTHIVIEYLAWDESVQIRSAPNDAKPFAPGGFSPTDLAYVTQYGGWLEAFAKHLGALGDLPEGADSRLTEEQRTLARKIVRQFHDDVDAFKALTPTSRFQGSYDKTAEALRQFEVAFTEGEKDLDKPGSGDETKATGAAEKGGQLLQDAADLFKTESKSQ